MKSRRGGKRSHGLFSRVWSPFHHVLRVGENSVGTVTNTAKGVVRQGFRGVNSIGRSVTGHANGMIRNMIKRRKTRKGSRKTRKGSRKERKTRR